MARAGVLTFLLLFTLSNIRTEDGVSEELVETPVKQKVVLFDLEESQLTDLRASAEKSNYQTEVSQMMRIIVNNLYRNKEVFLRELISNAFDALDKVRFYSLKNPSVMDVNPDLHIRITIDPVKRVLVITDSGIGMTHEELAKNLGTIAKSGTRDFISKISEEQPANLSSQIGQFGVGFYSVFLVCDKVIVSSKSVEDTEQYIFEANTENYNIYKDPRGDTLKRGTSVVLYLNQESSEFLDEKRIINLIKKYSEFIQFNIYIYSKTDDEGKEVDYHWKHINDISPIWIRKSSEITEDEYKDFYNVIAYGKTKEKYGTPFGTVHFSAEGETNFKALLFIPHKLNDEFVNNPLKWKPKLKLYVRRVFISDDTRNFLPHYLSYIVGIIDSEDLPLNVGREMLQHNELVKVIKKKLVRKLLDYIKKLSEKKEEYEKFYQEFGNSLKFGIIDDSTNSNRIARLLRFYSTRSEKEYTTLDDYLKRMKPGQPGIFYITASSIEEAKKSPYMERISRKGYEILYLLDNIDEAIMQHLRIYENNMIYNIAKEGVKLPQSKSEEKLIKDKEEEFKPLVDWLKQTYYKSKVALVKLSTRLITSSCILVAPEHGYSGNMEKIVRYQTYVQGKVSGLDEMLTLPKNLELNPLHPLVKRMLDLVMTDPDSEDLKQNADICLNVGTLSGGYIIDDPVGLSKLLERLYLQSHNISYDNISQQIHDELGIDEEELDDTPSSEPSSSTTDTSKESADATSEVPDETSESKEKVAETNESPKDDSSNDDL